MRPEPYHFLAEIKKKQLAKLMKPKLKVVNMEYLAYYNNLQKQYLSNLHFTQNSFMSTLSILSAYKNKLMLCYFQNLVLDI